MTQLKIKYFLSGDFIRQGNFFFSKLQYLACGKGKSIWPRGNSLCLRVWEWVRASISVMLNFPISLMLSNYASEVQLAVPKWKNDLKGITVIIWLLQQPCIISQRWSGCLFFLLPCMRSRTEPQTWHLRGEKILCAQELLIMGTQITYLWTLILLFRAH